MIELFQFYNTYLKIIFKLNNKLYSFILNKGFNADMVNKIIYENFIEKLNEIDAQLKIVNIKFFINDDININLYPKFDIRIDNYILYLYIKYKKFNNINYISYTKKKFNNYINNIKKYKYIYIKKENNLYKIPHYINLNAQYLNKFIN